MCEPHLPDNWPWRDLKIAVQRCSPSNLTELESICREEWEKLPKYRGLNTFQMHCIRWIWVFCFLSGGYTVGPKPLIDLLRQRSRPVGDHTMRFRNKMTEAGFTISGSDHPICPVMLGDARLATVQAEYEWMYVIGFSYPVVPKGKARIRVQISAAHTDQDIDHAVDAFIQTGRKHGVLP
uniref:Aminotransferase class I/classII large domain-containing protein n=1 Tax=Oncorhynchus mykiss TaxID=8022 RepID=A0A8C7VZW1_ONCMY